MKTADGFQLAAYSQEKDEIGVVEVIHMEQKENIK
jgi:hypothetical protein